MRAPETAIQAEATPPSTGQRVTPADLPEPSLSDNAITVLGKRYLKKDDDLKIVESPKDMFWRVARVIAEIGANYGASVKQVDASAR